MVAVDNATWTDADLVRLAKRGDPAAWTVMYERYRHRVFGHAVKILDDHEAAADVTNDAFVKVWARLPGMDADGSLNLVSYLHRAVRNLCLDQLRRQQRLRWVPWDADFHDDLLASRSADGDPAMRAELTEQQQMVRRAMNQMGQRHRTALYLREWSGLSCTEIGLALGLSRSATKSVLFRAREELRGILLQTEMKAEGRVA